VTYAGYPVFAHTSPIYLRVPDTLSRRAEALGASIDEIDRSMRTIRKSYRFDSDAQRALAVGKFQEARNALAQMLTKSS